jgi:hypothetical protein
LKANREHREAKEEMVVMADQGVVVVTVVMLWEPTLRIWITTPLITWSMMLVLEMLLVVETAVTGAKAVLVEMVPPEILTEMVVMVVTEEMVTMEGMVEMRE